MSLHQSSLLDILFNIVSQLYVCIFHIVESTIFGYHLIDKHVTRLLWTWIKFKFFHKLCNKNLRVLKFLNHLDNVTEVFCWEQLENGPLGIFDISLEQYPELLDDITIGITLLDCFLRFKRHGLLPLGELLGCGVILLHQLTPFF